jgi:carbonic anhydrase
MLLALGTSLALASESDSSRPTSPAVSLSSPSEEAEGFGYFGKLAPPFWGRLNPAWGACSNGQIQAPVDLGRNLVHSRRFDDLNIDYEPITGEIFNNGHTIEVETEGENVLMIKGVPYHLVQFHFHVPSENTLEREGHDMELHLVHRNATGANAVIAVFLDRGATSGALTPIFDQLPDDVNVHHELEAPFNPATFLPQARYHVRYLGSLTTPPCTEGVRWFVLVTPVKVSDEHLARFHERIHFNARPVQRSLP